MRIKKYQKIICLGLALLSIMVLPCYANNFIVTGLSQFNTYNFEQNNISELFPNEIISIKGNDVFLKYTYTFYSDNPDLEIDPITRLRLFSSSSYYFALMRNDLYIDCNNQILHPIDEFIFKPEDSEETIKLYIYHAESKQLPVITIIDYYYENYDYVPLFNVIYIVDYVQSAVLNITTYTNLLIQNFGKLFTFMTGSALPWLLLGITLSLITYGIHTSKRII